MDRLETLSPGMSIIYGGNRVTRVSEELAAAFSRGDRLIVVQSSGDLLHIPAADWETARSAVDAATTAFAAMGTATDDQISAFFGAFARRLEDDSSFEPIAHANEADVASAKEAGRTSTRLQLSEEMRAGMIEGLLSWQRVDGRRDEIVHTTSHDGWRAEQVQSGLGVIGFVFEGRPNVFADAAGVIRSGNTVVFRIGSAALGTARAIVTSALAPSLQDAGLPPGAVSLVDSPSRATGWAMFSDPRLSLAVARGSGAAVAQLGAVARQAGIPVSLHGTGGAWIVASEHAEAEAFASAVYNSLDRKVCNTLNTCCVVGSRVDELVPIFLDALDRAGQRLGAVAKLHIAEGDEDVVPVSWFEPAPITRARGVSTEPRTELIANEHLGEEWEWEASPEVTLKIVPDVDEAVRLFNEQSPRFAASLISTDEGEHRHFWKTIESPFVGNGMTRWVDGQYALDEPELGLSNWQSGRLFGRSGILSGGSAYTIRTRAVQDDPDLGR